MITVGTCEFCGQTIAVPGDPPTQEDADKIAAMQCKCQEGARWRTARKAEKQIRDMFAGLGEETLLLLLAVVEATRSGQLESGSNLKLSSTVTAQIKVAGGCVVVNRVAKAKAQVTV